MWLKLLEVGFEICKMNAVERTLKLNKDNHFLFPPSLRLIDRGCIHPPVFNIQDELPQNWSEMSALKSRLSHTDAEAVNS